MAPETAMDPTETLLQGLTEPQLSAVRCTEGPLLVLAAAGSGKTRVITRRIAFLIGMGVPPWQILALTFTNKAAGEMRERVFELLLGPDGGDGAQDRRFRGLTVSTFHSLCARLLRKYAERAALPGLKPDYTIYDTADQQALMKKTITALDLSTSNWPPRSVLGSISNAKNELLDAASFEARAGDFYAKQIAQDLRRVTRPELRRGRGDRLRRPAAATPPRCWREATRSGPSCQERWRYLLIDEYQDTNRAQFQIASLLAGEGHAGGSRSPGPARAWRRPTRRRPNPRPNICVVGDPDQAIYGWRGADISNILDFEEHYPGRRVIMLGENFRSTEPILQRRRHADQAQHQTRKDKALFTSRGGRESAITVLCRDERHEAELDRGLVLGLMHDADESRDRVEGDGRLLPHECAELACDRGRDASERRSPTRIARGNRVLRPRRDQEHPGVSPRRRQPRATTVSPASGSSTPPPAGIGKATLDTASGRTPTRRGDLALGGAQPRQGAAGSVGPVNDRGQAAMAISSPRHDQRAGAGEGSFIGALRSARARSSELVEPGSSTESDAAKLITPSRPKRRGSANPTRNDWTTWPSLMTSRASQFEQRVRPRPTTRWPHSPTSRARWNRARTGEMPAAARAPACAISSRVEPRRGRRRGGSVHRARSR